ncbi:MAG TPA: diguanylate cyclase [Solirubrobacteraceae bacterium]|nr:diguanylate cyclase [Solirubrobacteraceae bacterium]
MWDERQRWLRMILWAHAIALTVFAALDAQQVAGVAPYLLVIVACAVAAHVDVFPRRLRSAAVAGGLLSFSVGLVALWDGSTAAWSHPFLVLALLMLYEDPLLLLLAAAVVLGTSVLGGPESRPSAGQVLLIVLVAAAGIVTGWLNGSLRDEAREATQRFRSSFDSAPIGMAIVSLKGRLVDVNGAFCEIVGYRRAVMLGMTLQELTLEEDRDADAQLVRQVVDGNRRTSQRQKRFLHAEGHVVWVNVSLSVVRGTSGAPDYLIAQIEDVTERKQTLDQLQHLADHDPLTGLLNRRRLEGELAHQVALSQRYGHRACLVMLDLDDFKSTNDSLGHGVGDELLKNIAEILRARVRNSDLVARLGGDEFALLLPQATREQARRVAEGIAKAIRERIHITEGHELRITASLGVATIEAGDVPDAVLLRADQALYEVKAQGRDGVSVAPPPLPAERRVPRN